jgi:hypothetical protein
LLIGTFDFIYGLSGLFIPSAENEIGFGTVMGILAMVGPILLPFYIQIMFTILKTLGSNAAAFVDK